ncbi:uncharacterized protein LOC134832204 [Culicoides brevitarsis]|uniref:uncharacterized protein LOC134832204 n=1 Tax=Culicoides brevitarsis TaxID=469753 RepID=UPI00307C102E
MISKFFVFIALLLLNSKADSVLNDAVGTCSVQSGEILPDAACYDNCLDTEEQRHFLTCIEMVCYCRLVGDARSISPPADPVVPLNAGGVTEKPSENVPTVYVPSENVNSTTLSASVESSAVTEATNNGTTSSETPKMAENQTESTSSSSLGSSSVPGDVSSSTNATPKV